MKPVSRGLSVRIEKPNNKVIEIKPVEVESQQQQQTITILDATIEPEFEPITVFIDPNKREEVEIN